MFMTFDEFTHSFVKRRWISPSLEDAGWMSFKGIEYDSLKDTYFADISLRKDILAKELETGLFSFRSKYSLLDNTMLNHWSQWLSIAITIKSRPELDGCYFFVTDHHATYLEPCFGDKPVRFNIQLLTFQKKRNKTLLLYLHTLDNGKVIYRVNFTVMKEAFDVMKHYYEK